MKKLNTLNLIQIMKMFMGNIRQDLFCKIIIDLLKSSSLSASELKQKSKLVYKKRMDKEIPHTSLIISDGEYYYRMRRLIHDGIIQKQGKRYILIKRWKMPICPKCGREVEEGMK